MLVIVTLPYLSLFAEERKKTQYAVWLALFSLSCYNPVVVQCCRVTVVVDLLVEIFKWSLSHFNSLDY